MPISFPGLFEGWEFNPDPIALHIGHGVYWYGIILAFAMLMGLLLCMRQAERFGLKEDHVLDMVLWGCPAACWALGSTTSSFIWTSTAGPMAAWTGGA